LGGQSIGRIIHRADDPNNHDNQIDIMLDAGAPRGAWQVVLARKGGGSVPYHAWIERDDSGPSQFAERQADPHFTLGSIACGREPIVVAAYDAHFQDAIAPFSGEGPTRDGRQKPDFSAPGRDVIAANATKSGTVSMSGTSMSAPHVTGLIALMMQAAGRPLTMAEIRGALTAGARKQSQSQWDSRYGFGAIDGVRALQAVTTNVPQPHTAFQPIPPGHAGTSSWLQELVQRRATNIRVRIEFDIDATQ
jgi:subtilisin family serine protease